MVPEKVTNEIQPELMSLNALPGAAGAGISSARSLMYGSHLPQSVPISKITAKRIQNDALNSISEFDMNNRFTQNLLSNKLLKVQDFRNFLKQASQLFKHVVYVMGNHEFYGGRFFGSILHLQEELEPFENIYLLENNAKELDGVLFLGATFWTDFNKHDPISMYDAGLFMNDYKSIRWDKDGLYRKLAPKDSFGRHVRSAHYFR